MKTRQLGNSDMHITLIGFGAWAIGGSGWAFAWGAQDDNHSIASIREGLDAGINWIDTAAVYGLGHSEQIVARALEGAHNRPYIFTKCSLVWDEKRKISNCLKAESVRRECEDSLKRLKVDAIDLYQIHWAIPDAEIEEGWQTLAKLKEEGKVRFIGMSGTMPQLEDHIAMNVFDVFQVPYSIVEREHEDLIHKAARGGAGIVIRGGVARGVMVKEASVIDEYPAFLQPAFHARRTLWQQSNVDDLLEGMTPMEFMLRFTISNPDMSTTIVGTANPAHLLINVNAAAKGSLPGDIYQEACKRFPKMAAEQYLNQLS